MRPTVGHYRILEKLGEGGMGEVWKAQDTRLDRFVALKILPPGKTADEDRKRRFVQEAKSASALHHPNIVTIYDIGSDDGLDYIAMEYVAGSTLEHTIGAKGIALRQAIAWAIQIADALGRAHAKGIVHRDIKPGNVMIDEMGAVRVLDFGLSKLLDPPVTADPTDQTMTIRPAARTEEGRLVGTVAYMSPEQAEGRPVDARSDIFSFGALLYEMVTGKRPFRGESKLSILAAILREEPASVSSLSFGTPPELERIIAQCMRKDPARRYQHMDDVRIALEDLKADSESGMRPAAVAAKRPAWPWIGAAIVALGGIAGFLALRPHTSAATATGPALKRLTFDSGLTTDAALSPDGRLLAYASDRGGNGGLDIWVQQLAGGDPTRITSRPEDEYEPVFSPDGTHIAYRSDAAPGGIDIISALGGQPRLLVPEGRGPRYSPDGAQIAFWKGNPTHGTPYSRGAASIWIIPAQGGVPRQLAAELSVAARPEFTADGRHVMFFGLPPHTPSQQIEFWSVGLDGQPAVKTDVREALTKRNLRILSRYPTLVRSGSGRYLITAGTAESQNLWSFTLTPEWKTQDPRQLTFGTQFESQPAVAANRVAFNAETDSTQIWSVPLDANRGQVQGEPQQLTHGSESGLPVLTPDGKKLSYVARRPGELRLVLRDLTTDAESVVASGRYLHHPTLSADGEHVAYRTRTANHVELMVAPSTGASATKLCGDECGMTLAWTLDGRQVMFKKGFGIGLLDRTSGQQTDLLQHPMHELWQSQMSPDGKWVAFLEIESDGQSIHVAPFHPHIKPEEWITPIPAGPENDKPRWSPDGRMLYFTSSRDGYRCVWAQRLNANKTAAGEPFPVMHFHSAVRSPSNVNLYELETAVAPGRLVIVLGERRGNIWTTAAP